MAAKLGKANFGGNYVKRKFFKLKDGEASYRILPSIGFNGKEPDGRWSVFHKVHYGYRNSKGQMRVFLSPEVKNRKTKMTEVEDAALERIKKLKAELEKAKAAGNKPLQDKLMELVGSMDAKYNLDNNHYLNAIDEQGNIGVLKLRHKAKLALDAEIKKLRDAGVEPLDPETGRFFKFFRTGTGLETTFQVTVKKKTLVLEGVGEVEQALVHVITDEILQRIDKEAADLDKIYKVLSAEDVKRIVETSDINTGISPVIDELFDNKKDAEPAVVDEEDYADDAEQPAAAAQTAPVVTPLATPAPATQTVATTPAPATATTVKTASAPKTTAQVVGEQSDEDFLKSLGL